MCDLKEGVKAPDFVLADARGKNHILSDYKGYNVVLYFYPKDNTSGCTKEVCDFRNDHSIYKNHGVVIHGVYPDSVKSHAEFSGKLDLPFTLLSDTDKKVLKLYGAWEKNPCMAGIIWA